LAEASKLQIKTFWQRSSRGKFENLEKKEIAKIESKGILSHFRD
jgi:hypothetical protein